MQPQSIRTLVLTLLGILALTVACDPVTSPNITPTVTLNFTVLDAFQTPQSGAVIYLFPFEGTYEDYLSENPDGDPDITPSLSAENIRTTDANGEVSFLERPLEGSSYAADGTWYHRPNAIYFRILSESGGEFLTNDGGEVRLSFEEIESGERIEEFIEVIIE